MMNNIVKLNRQEFFKLVSVTPFTVPLTYIIDEKGEATLTTEFAGVKFMCVNDYAI